MIDLRSDTVTRPSQGMLDAMMSARVGDDVFGDDPTVNELQSSIARMFGMEDAIFCPSGTMTNQIAMRVLTRPQDEVVCHKHSHVYLYEGGGMMYNSMLSPKLLEGDRGRITAAQVQDSMNPDEIHFPKTKLVVLENTMNKGGGSIYDLEEMQSIKNVCAENELKLHLDGARLFNALVETGEDPVLYSKLFDTISICFSKGLGAPVGSVLLGSRETIREARRVRKVLGGAMRQSGYLAAACLYALNHNRERLKEDHGKARTIASTLKDLPFVAEVMPVDTNIVIARLDEGHTDGWFLDQLQKKDIRAVSFGNGLVRFVTHLDFTDNDLEDFQTALAKLSI